jgi:protocatechuate 3,4-dioxygenase beta subunit
LKLLNRLFRRDAARIHAFARHVTPKHRAVRRLQGVETMEARYLLSVSPINVGAIYTELDIGADVSGDSFEITFSGGADGTQLSRVTIDGDQNIVGFGVGDVFFDVAPEGLGADDAFNFSPGAFQGIDDLRVTVVDGSSKLTLEFDGFDAGETLLFSIDVDEVEDFDPRQSDVEILNDGFDPITSGVEFQGSLFTAEFTAADFYDVSQTTEFRNRYDEALIASGLDLPADDFNNQRDRTAGAFAQLQQAFIPAEISGYVYHDRNDDGIRDRGEEGIAAVTVQVIPLSTVDDQAPLTVITDSSGFYHVSGLAPGMYRVVEVQQPEGYLDGKDTAGTISGTLVGTAANESIESILLGGGQAGIEYNFGELLPASIGGRVQLSTRDGDCFGVNFEHEPVEGATILLIDGDGNVIAETTTDANGQYEFTGLAPGTYGIVEITPDGLLNGGAQVGSLGGELGSLDLGDSITEIDLGSGNSGENYNFCEREPAKISGHVFDDHDNDGAREAEEAGIADVLVTLYDAQGHVVATTTTDENGYYEFCDLEAGIYTLRETQPGDYIDGLDAAGTIGGQTVGRAKNPGDEITDIVLGYGDLGVDYDFGEYLGASISGRVQLSTRDGDCFGEGADHEPVVGAVVQLYDADGNLVAETVTDANGQYSFNGLAPGRYSIVEITPAGLIDGGAMAGTIDGKTVGSVGAAGDIMGVQLTSGDQAQRFDFCEHEPSTIEGKVYHDRNQNGVQDPGEEGIAGVVIQLFDKQDNLVATTVTDENGCYKIEGILAGQYNLFEIQPDNYLDGIDTAGQINGLTSGAADNPGDTIRCIDIGWGDEGTDFNFGEILPATISGRVHFDIVLDCELNPLDGEATIEGVKIELLDENGKVVATTTTDALGQYRFTGVRPGSYTVREIQPEGYFDGASGNLMSVTAASGESIEDVNFCEIPPATLSGFVFKDGETVELESDEQLPTRIADIRDGVRTGDDAPIAGAVVELRDGITGLPIFASTALPGAYPEGPIRLTTDVRGFYEFGGLRPGTYSVYEVQPDRFIDGVDTPGSTSGFVFNPGEPVNQVVLQTLAVDPQNNAIVRISLPPGSSSIENNFSEINALRLPPPFDPPFIPDPPPTPLPPPTAPPLVLGLDPINPTRRIAWQYVSLGDGSDSTQNHTWHLSVIDAGQPRGEGLSHGEPDHIWLTRAGRYGEARGVIDVGVWELGDDYGVRTTRERSLRLGIKGAIPITGDFNGDGYDEVALFLKGEWFIDVNTNGFWDADDLWARLGDKDDYPVTGDWDGDGKDDIGIYGRQWAGDPKAIVKEPGLPDYENDVASKPKNVPPRRKDAPVGVRLLQNSMKGQVRADLIDHVFEFGRPSDFPVVGDWNGDGIASIGLFREGHWTLDVDGDGKWTDDDRTVRFGHRRDAAVVGDWDGDGLDDLGVYRDGVFILDTNGNQQLDGGDLRISRGSPDDTPVVGDWDGDGKDNVGVYKIRTEMPPTQVANKAG